VGLVASAGLPTADLAPGTVEFWALVDEGAAPGAGLVGVIGTQALGPDEALVRSFAVADGLRGQGRGAALYRALEARARQVGLRSLVLLTETAEAFFAARGFAVVPRDSLSPAVRASAEFTGLCPVSAVAMVKRL